MTLGPPCPPKAEVLISFRPIIYHTQFHSQDITFEQAAKLTTSKPGYEIPCPAPLTISYSTKSLSPCNTLAPSSCHSGRWRTNKKLLTLQEIMIDTVSPSQMVIWTWLVATYGTFSYGNLPLLNDNQPFK